MERTCFGGRRPVAARLARAAMTALLRAVLPALLLAACGGSGSAHPRPAAATGTGARTSIGSGLPAGTHSARFVDRPVSFIAGGVTVHGTYRHPASGSGTVPAVLLIAGSGPTDRDGNTPEIHGRVGTLQALADWLGADGVATLRYDKLGVGATGLGPYGADPAQVGIAPFEQEAAAGLRFLAAQPGVARGRIGVFGHSEGALFALLAATGHGAGIAVPPVRALGLLEPLSGRYLTVLARQLVGQLSAEVAAGRVPDGAARRILAALRRTVRQLRSVGTAPAGLPGGLGTVFSANTARFLSEADRYDPAVLAASLPRGTPVLTSCSRADIQVSCAEVASLDAGAERAGLALDAVHLSGVDHMLKLDPSRTAARYGEPLPFSPQLRRAIAAFVRRALT